MSVRIATLVADRLPGFAGHAKLYAVQPPMEYSGWTDEGGTVTHETGHVVVSAAVAMFSGPETYIFPASEDGTIVDWGELHGSFRGGLDHVQALENAGYEVQG